MLANLAVLLSLGTSALAGSALTERATPSLKSLLSQLKHAGAPVHKWSTYEAPTYIASVRPACVQKLITIVKIATANNIPFLATGGGHSFSIHLSGIKNGPEIGMKGLKAVHVDRSASTMTVTGAVTSHDVLEPLYTAGKEITHH